MFHQMPTPNSDNICDSAEAPVTDAPVTDAPAGTECPMNNGEEKYVNPSFFHFHSLNYRLVSSPTMKIFVTPRLSPCQGQWTWQWEKSLESR